MKDFLGREYDVGDRIVYPVSSGHCINTVLAEVVEIKEDGKVKVQPIEAARWVRHHGRTRYIDSRTGKGIDPYRNKSATKEPAHYRNRYDDTITEEQHRALSWLSRAENDWQWVPPVWHDWVEVVKEGPKPVTLQITKNIVKV